MNRSRFTLFNNIAASRIKVFAKVSRRASRSFFIATKSMTRTVRSVCVTTRAQRVRPMMSETLRMRSSAVGSPFLVSANSTARPASMT